MFELRVDEHKLVEGFFVWALFNVVLQLLIISNKLFELVNARPKILHISLVESSFSLFVGVHLQFLSLLHLSQHPYM